MTPPAARALEHRTGAFRAADGVEIRWQAWIPVHATAAVLLSHGLGEHGGRYARLAGELAEHGIAVWVPDHRGHGLSGGPRGHAARFDDLARDFEAFRLHVSASIGADLPLFLYGHSLGGLIALRYLQTHPQLPFRGAVLSAPLLGFHIRPPRWKTALAAVLNRLLPTARFANEVDPAGLSHDAEYVRSYRDDPLVHPWLTPRLFAELVAAISLALHEGAALRLPLLFLLPGADPIVRTDVAREFAATLGGDVTVREYAGMFHEPHNEVDRALVTADVVAWITAHAAADRPAGLPI
ncbi:MAG TPA: alpha/beta hydrolase [Longimicrobiaceae bacterium]|nr:alpha/beta hydrolase [Longimicrobiaceae bacterium]